MRKFNNNNDEETILNEGLEVLEEGEIGIISEDRDWKIGGMMSGMGRKGNDE